MGSYILRPTDVSFFPPYLFAPATKNIIGQPHQPVRRTRLQNGNEIFLPSSISIKAHLTKSKSSHRLIDCTIHMQSTINARPIDDADATTPSHQPPPLPPMLASAFNLYRQTPTVASLPTSDIRHHQHDHDLTTSCR